jgi:hypothetical protein
MTWAAAQEAIRLVVAEASGLADYAGADGATYHGVEWADRAGAATWEAPVNIELELGVVMPHGRTETRRAPDINGEWVETVNSTVTMVVRIRVKSNSQEPGEDAVGYVAGRIRARIRSEVCRGILRNAGVAFIDQLATINASFRNQEARMDSYCITDMRFGYTEQYTQEGLGLGGDYIARAEGEATLSGGAGADRNPLFDSDA